MTNGLTSEKTPVENSGNGKECVYPVQILYQIIHLHQQIVIEPTMCQIVF